MGDMSDLIKRAATPHEFELEWCKGYAAYNSDFEWDDGKPEMWKLGYLYGYLNQKGGAIPQ